TSSRPSPTHVQAPPCADSFQAVAVYRDFNDGPGNHFYTVSTPLLSADAANASDYFLEGLHFAVFPTPISSTTPLIRLWNGDAPDHFYTTDATETNEVAAGGYVLEHLTPMFVYPTQLCGSILFYRLCNPANRDHVYTTSATERDGETGYTFGLIVGYILPLASGPSSASGNVAAGTGDSTPRSASDPASPPRVYLEPRRGLASRTNTKAASPQSPHGAWLLFLLAFSVAAL
ncbi:hypothetical protein DFH08DRAFT_690260, partial [Mycena albidolilacea]